ncbi:coiled-coil domain-containing protein 149-like [Dreissena polymorpha]|uniref:Coiled-coil domain-containing protein 149 n=1 Tax=Dreissena polymorpha TaxID=45954 RepID=A0A9D4IW46_DREPO|nr:coiled-coil domain-containing protein 149-like [Dreissena polymorpha]KAH3786348.1 hypothetical protein DPMN_164455 [Dreissena polymorpha]
MIKRKEHAAVTISNEEYARLQTKFDGLKNEFTACKRKLDSKCEALLILSQDLDQCRSERDQFKLMAEQLQERYQSMKKSISGQPTQSSSDTVISRPYSDSQSQNLARLLLESRENSKSLRFEADDLKQKLNDAQGDIKLLREQIARQRVGTTDEGMTIRHFPAHEREQLVEKLEAASEQYLQLERDLQTVLDEKEELVTERDAYKTKYDRLNHELNYILKGDEHRVVDIDALVMENKYLQDRLQQMEEEKSMALAAVSKYKNLLDKKKTKSSLKFGQSRGGGMIITQRQVQEVLESRSSVVPTVKAMTDLQALAGALLDSVNDKNLALSHQRKTNKILGNRVAELEKKIKTLELTGLWSVPASTSSSLERLRQDIDDVRTLVPSHSPEEEMDSERLSFLEGADSELETVTSLDSPEPSPESSPQHACKPLNNLELGDLDLLPTKEVSDKPLHNRELKTGHMNVQDSSHIPALLKPPERSVPNCQVNHAATPETRCESPEYPRGRVEQLVDLGNGGSEGVTDQGPEYPRGRVEQLVDLGNGGSVGVTDQVPEYPRGRVEQLVDFGNGVNVGDTDKEGLKLHVYDEDYQESNGCDIDGSDNTNRVNIVDDEIDEQIGECNNGGNLEEFYNDVDENHEQVGLLLENVANKMCNISHSSVNCDGAKCNKSTTRLLNVDGVQTDGVGNQTEDIGEDSLECGPRNVEC